MLFKKLWNNEEEDIMNQGKMDSFEPIDEKERIDMTPVKSFFVSMLTRDIKLEDAILDLLDNCVDGIHRSIKNSDGIKPYLGFKAEIEFNKGLFSISDNCGGIPWELHHYAFKLGRDPKNTEKIPDSVGAYGIGMKRAIFKMGQHCHITTKHGLNRYKIEITRKWMESEDWELDVKNAEWISEQDGTKIEITELHEGIERMFDEDPENFKTGLEQIIQTQYAYIIEQGFEVKINGTTVTPITTKLVFDKRLDEKNPVRPYIFKTSTPEGIEVFLTVGFTQPPQSQEQLDNQKVSDTYKAKDAGWTILCNERAVVFNDRTELTGWGEANVPHFHNQFNAISGIVEFKSKDASLLPTTTTKRGIDASNRLYLQIKNKMRDGMKEFTSSTNKWKGHEDDLKKKIKNAPRLTLSEVKEESKKLTFSKILRSSPPGELSKPPLPTPPVVESSKKKILFYKDKSKIEKVADYFEMSDSDPSSIGEKCFDTIYEETKK
jgi:hypothetical protein